jgi:hypothetical protein
MTGTTRGSRIPATVIPWLAVVADLFCLCIFVLLGRESHGLDTGVGWFVTVVWPFIVAWFLVAAVVRLYTRHIQWRRVALTLIFGIAVALVSRVTLTHRTAPIAFLIVAYVFNTMTILGWRLALTAWVHFTRPSAR